MSEVIELKIHEEADKASKQLMNPAFEAYINLEGVFQGVERVVGDTVSKIFRIILDKSRDKCFYIRISLRGRETSKWDELSLIICGSTVIAASGTIDGKEKIGGEILSRIIEKIRNKYYASALLEFIELPLDFPVKRFGISIESIIGDYSAIEERKARKSVVSRITAPPTASASPASTIPIKSGMEETQILPRNAMKKFYQKILPRLPSIARPREEAVIEETVTESIDDVLYYERRFLKIMEIIVNNIPPSEANISVIRIRRRGNRLLVEVNVAKLGLVMKREKMMKIANLVMDLIGNILSRDSNHLKFEGVDVIVKHGWDLVKTSR